MAGLSPVLPFNPIQFGGGLDEKPGLMADLVMQESARAAVSYVRSRAAEWGLDSDGSWVLRKTMIVCP